MNVFSRSWEITRESFSIINKEKQILTFPILSGVISLIFIILMFFPIIFGLLLSSVAGKSAMTATLWLLVFASYLGVYFIATFFNVCTVQTAAVSFSNKDAKFASTLKFAFSRIHVIFLWSLMLATVGMILRILEGIARRARGIGSIILSITESILGLAWSIATIFVIPVMVYENTGPFASIKSSVQVLRKTWGESIIRAVGLGLTEFIFIFLGIIIFIPLLFVLASTGYLLVIFLILFIIYEIFIILLFGAATSVFNTALYIYAKTGNAPGSFDKDTLKSGFKSRKSPLQFIK